MTDPLSALDQSRRASRWADVAPAWRSPKRIPALLDVIKRSRPARTFLRFLGQQGPLLCAGIAYMSLFSLTAAITVGWTAFTAVLGDHEQLRSSVIDAVNDMLPGLFISPASPHGLVDPDTLVSESSGLAAGIIAAGIALFTATSVVKSLARALRAMFGIGNLQEKPGTVLAQRIIGLVTLFVGVLSIAVLTSLGTLFHQTVTDWLGESSSTYLRPLYRLTTILMPLVVEFFVFVSLVRYVAGILPPLWDLMQGGILFAAGSFVLRLLGTSVLAANVSGPILSAAASLITLIVWVNLLAWVTLLAAAWTANPPGPPPGRTADTKIPGRPNYVTLSHPETLKWLPEVMAHLPEDVAAPVTVGNEPSPEHDPKTATPKSEPDTH